MLTYHLMMQDTVTGVNNVTANLTQSYDFCNERVYTVDQVLLPAANYTATPTDFFASASSSLVPPPIGCCFLPTVLLTMHS